MRAAVPLALVVGLSLLAACEDQPSLDERIAQWDAESERMECRLAQADLRYFRERMTEEEIAFARRCVATTHEERAAAIAAGEQMVADVMRDPSAAQFQDVRYVVVEGFASVCGEYNGKNAYGAYVGFSRFIAEPGVQVILERDRSDFPEVWESRCQRRED